MITSQPVNPCTQGAGLCPQHLNNCRPKDAVVRAEQAVAEAREALTVYAATTRTVTADGLAPHIDALVRAVRELVACEIERSEFQRGPISGSNHYVGGYSDGLGDATRIARDGLTKEPR